MTYELRDITSKDLFAMMQIIRKIGVKEFKTAFTGVQLFTDDKGNLDLGKMGIPIALDLGAILIENLPNAETEIYNFLKNLSGVPVNRRFFQCPSYGLLQRSISYRRLLSV